MIPNLTKKGQQSSWRWCPKCAGIFFDGFQGKGVCPSGGSHEAPGFNYVMQHDLPNHLRPKTNGDSELNAV
jgi:hypothetical protein